MDIRVRLCLATAIAVKKRSAAASKSSPGARERIVRTALKLFYQEGIRATGIDRIIADSGVAKMSFYRHFPSKNDLIAECLTVHHQNLIGRFTEAMDRHPLRQGTGLEALADALEEWFREPGFRGCPFINALAESPQRKSAPNKKVRAYKAELESFIALQAARLGWESPQMVASWVMIVLEGTIVRAQTLGSAAAAEECRELLKMIAVEARKPSRAGREDEAGPPGGQLMLPGLF